MDKVISIGIEILFVISFVAFSFYSILPEDYAIPGIVYLTIAVAGLCGYWFIHKTKSTLLLYMKKHKTLDIFVFIYAVYYMFLLYQQKSLESAGKLFAPLPIFAVGCYMLGCVAVCFLALFIIDKSTEWLKELFAQLTENDKKEYRLFAWIFSITLIVFYIYTNGWYLQYDVVYSMDSGYCYNNILASSYYYDIRHPLLGVVTFPVWAFVQMIGNVLIPSHILKTFVAVAIGLFNIQLLLLVGLQLKVLANHAYVFRIYVISFPSMIYMFMLEKYAICVFLLVLYLYSVCKTERRRAKGSLLLATGSMPTSAVIGFVELFENGSFKHRVARIVKLVIAFLGMHICFGRAHVLWYGVEELLLTKQRFGEEVLPLHNRIYSVFDMIRGAFVAQSSVLTEKYLWISVGQEISVVGIVILIVVILGIYEGWKHKHTKICSLWLLFAFILFVLLQWSPHESPLFSIYFSWALVLLFVQGLDGLVDEFKWNQKYVYRGILTIMGIINVITVLDINRFLKFYF